MNDTEFRADLCDWWWNFHQRGIFIHCHHTFWPCIVENLTHGLYAHRLMLRRRTGWRWICRTVPYSSPLCRWHDDRVNRNIARHEYGDRARRIRKLGWGR